VSLAFTGRTAGFPINAVILNKLGLKLGDLVEIEVFLEYKGEPSFTINRKIRKMGSSLGISLRKYIVENLGLKKGDTFQIDIKVPLIKK
ncbi:MAG TPA: hypothetical protein VGB37_17830, partial [Candidatus Lokiarchaeia archaeon]